MKKIIFYVLAILSGLFLILFFHKASTGGATSPGLPPPGFCWYKKISPGTGCDTGVIQNVLISICNCLKKNDSNCNCRKEDLNNHSKYTRLGECSPLSDPIAHFVTGFGIFGDSLKWRIPTTDPTGQCLINDLTGTEKERFFLEFGIKVPCNTIPDIESQTGNNIHFIGPTISTVDWFLKIFENGVEIQIDSIESVIIAKDFYQFNRESIDSSHYVADCIELEKSVYETRCRAKVQMATSFMVNKGNKYHIVFGVQDTHGDIIFEPEQKNNSDSISCELPPVFLSDYICIDKSSVHISDHIFIDSFPICR